MVPKQSSAGHVSTDSECEGGMSPNSFNSKMVKFLESGLKKKLRSYSERGFTSKRAFRRILIKILNRAERDLDYMEEP
jgi:hypothetical protein